MFYTVGEIARKLNIPPSTLRYYDKEGLLPFVERSSGGIRMFSDKDFESLSVIECLKKAGMSIKDIRLFMEWCAEGDSTIPKRLSMFRRQREQVLSQITQLKETLEILDYKEWYYETAAQAGTCAIHETLDPKEIPDRFRSIQQKLKNTPTEAP
ncbi:MAG: MerR family transcriptional regulator [Lachnospiraceae bacterium]|jgi:DNA-binding transcriptional MerR regulator|nr:MerR family transcriptional regulator [Lachnospiraceae bacterium]